MLANLGFFPPQIPVSYTHLDVYKRQAYAGGNPVRDCGHDPAFRYAAADGRYVCNRLRSNVLWTKRL